MAAASGGSIPEIAVITAAVVAASRDCIPEIADRAYRVAAAFAGRAAAALGFREKRPVRPCCAWWSEPSAGDSGAKTKATVSVAEKGPHCQRLRPCAVAAAAADAMRDGWSVPSCAAIIIIIIISTAGVTQRTHRGFERESCASIL